MTHDDGSTAARARELATIALDLDEGLAAELVAALDADGVELELGPRSGLTMMTARDAFDTVFCLGEALVTEAVVRRGDLRGWGVVLGDAPQRAVLVAVLELLGREGHGSALARAADLLAPAAARADAARAREAGLVARTRVQFDLMPGK